MLTKRRLLKVFGSEQAIANLLQITLQAVRKWPMDSSIPQLREVQLQTMFPKKFGRPKAEIRSKSRQKMEGEIRAA